MELLCCSKSNEDEDGKVVKVCVGRIMASAKISRPYFLLGIYQGFIGVVLCELYRIF